jgi:hypothetical protein
VTRSTRHVRELLAFADPGERMELITVGDSRRFAVSFCRVDLDAKEALFGWPGGGQTIVRFDQVASLTSLGTLLVLPAVPPPD